METAVLPLSLDSKCRKVAIVFVTAGPNDDLFYRFMLFKTRFFKSHNWKKSDFFYSLLFPIVLFSCSGEHATKSGKDMFESHHDDTLEVEKQETAASKKSGSQDEVEVFDVEQMLFNGKMKRFVKLDEFRNTFGEPDSIKLLSEVDPCTHIFDNGTGAFDADNKYLYKDGSCFENYRDSVAIDEFRFDGNNFLKYKNVIFNSSTTEDDLKKVFPKAMKEIETIDVHLEGKLQLIRLREDENNISDGKIYMFIKNHRLYFMHWWFPC